MIDLKIKPVNLDVTIGILPLFSLVSKLTLIDYNI